jgi:hypothetical protein
MGRRRTSLGGNELGVNVLVGRPAAAAAAATVTNSIGMQTSLAVG